MTIDAGLKPEGAPERSPIAGAGAPSGVEAGPKRYSVQRKMAVVARLLRGVTLRPEFEVGPGGLKAGFGMVSGLGASWSASEVGSVRRRRADRAG